MAVLVVYAEGRAGRVVRVDVPEDVHGLEGLARDGVPIVLGVGDRGYGGARVRAGYWPAYIGTVSWAAHWSKEKADDIPVSVTHTHLPGETELTALRVAVTESQKVLYASPMAVF